MSQPKVVVSRKIPQPAIEMLRPHVELDLNADDTPYSAEQLQAKVADADVLLSLLTDPINDALLAAGTKLKAVCNVAVGYNNIDVDAATKRNVMITNTPEVLTETTADFAFSLIMSTARRVVEGDKFLRAGKFHGWEIDMLLGQDVHHATLGIVGLGRIGLAVARRAKGFEMTTLYYDARRADEATEKEYGLQYVEMDELLTRSDFVSLNVPLLPTTKHLLNAEAFKKMKNTAIVINTARGPVIDEAALVDALKSGEIAGAGLDVFEEEPKVHPGLLELDNVVLCPHIASASIATRTRMGTMAAENCLAILRGETPPNLVNRDLAN